jgi:hypothetical protein
VNTTVAPLPIGRCPPYPGGHEHSLSAALSPAKCNGAVAPALQATPSVVALVDSQIFGCQRVSPATVAWNFLPPDLAAIDIGEVDDRCTISREHAPATLFNSTTYNKRTRYH